MLGCLSQTYSHYSGYAFVYESVVSMTNAGHIAKDGVALTRNSYSFHFILNNSIILKILEVALNLIKQMISKL